MQTSINLDPQFSGLMTKESVAAGGFVCLGCHNRPGGLNKRNYYSVLEGEESKIKVPSRQVSF